MSWSQHPRVAPYVAALDQLYQLGRLGVCFGLERMQRALERLGHPERRYLCIHLAGTNGKGSTAAMLAACLAEAGLRTALYTSPHLCRFSERIQINGVEIEREAVARLVPRVLELEPELTFFEATTAVALSYFAEQQVDIAVIETGLGGRLDATNAVSPAVSVLTRIDLDHTDLLGTGLLAVAGEKAGIIKPGVPVVSAPAPSEVVTLLEERCAAQGTELCLLGRDVHCEGFDAAGCITFRGRVWPPLRQRLGLAGRHQIENAGLCLATLELLSTRIPGITGITDGSIARGLLGVRWPGRLERVGERFLLDGAHNRCGMQALAAALDPNLPYTAVLGLLAPRDVRDVAEPLLPRVGRIICTRPRSPRGLDPVALARELGRGAEVAADLRATLELARADARVLITGSLYLVGEARTLLLGEEEDPRPLADPLPVGR